jgi:hypothetical protein
MSLLTRHGYIVSEDDLTEKHINELTVIANKGPYYDDAKPFSVFEDRHDGTVAIPRYWGEENFGNAEELFGHTESSSNLVFRGSLRSDLQREAVDKSIKQLKTQGGGVLSLFTGCGKTTISLYIACVLKLKTLVVVHKQFLLDQWEERIETFVPFARIGRLQQNIEDVADCDIVVGMLQSIAMREYDEDIFSDFGLIIFDEVHVVPAPVFSRALLRLCAPYMLGLSATPIRKDGLSKVIHWFIGPIFFEHFLTGQDNVTVEVMHFKLRRKLPMNMVVAITMLCNMTQRNTLLVEKAANLVSMGYKVMFLSDRRAHCETLRNDLLDIGIEGGLYLGSMKSFELERSKQKQVLLGTYHLAKEGLDIPTLDALILATPRSDVVQACGRILHGKTSLSPVIVDLVDDWIISKAQFNKRNIYYNKSGFTVKYN